MTYTLPLTNSNEVTLVDEDTYNTYKDVKFCLTPKGYVRTTRKINRKFIHVLIASSGTLHVDHINGNKLDNRRCNLRLCTNQQNLCNRGKTKLNTSGYKGVSNHQGKWRCAVWLNGKSTRISGYSTTHSAAIVYNILSHELHGEYAQGNVTSDLHALYYYELAH